MQRNLLIANLALSLTFLLIVILSFNGNIHFGNGLGDIFPIGITTLAFLIQLILTLLFHFSKKADIKEFRTLLLIFSCVLLFLIYKFTLARGPESPWDGTVFF